MAVIISRRSSCRPNFATAPDSEAPGKAAVHCVIVGFDRGDNSKPELWDYPTFKSEPVKISPIMHGINGYLVDGPNVLVTTRSTPLNSNVAKVAFGSVPRDGGNLIVGPKEIEEVRQDPIALKYLHPYVGARELLHGDQRWCFWLEDLDPNDAIESPILKQRIAAVKEFRENSKSPDAQAAAATPHLFWWRAHTGTDYLCVPSVVSERRPYFTAQRLNGDVVSSNAVFVADDADGLQFALISSSMFITWQRTVGGRLKSDLRFSGNLVWNNFPLPPLTAYERERIIAAGRAIANVREQFPDRSLAQLYNPLAMAPALIKAHEVLDREVDKAFGATRKLTTERQRQELLFARYTELTN